MPSESPNSARRAPYWPALLLTTMFVTGCVWAVFAHRMTDQAQDHFNFHYPAIRKLMQQFPTLDFTNFLSATTPLYHVTIAWIGRLLGASEQSLILISTALSATLLWIVIRLLGRRIPDGLTVLCLALPFFATRHTWAPGMELLPDNAGWLGVVGLLAWALIRMPTGANMVVAGVGLLALALTRQVHVFMFAVLMMWAWIGPTLRGPRVGDDPLVPLDELTRSPGSRLGRCAVMGVQAIPVVLALLYFHHLWEGLIPQRFHRIHAEGVAWYTPAFILSHLFLASMFYAGWIIPALRRAWATHRRWLIIAALVGVVLSVLGPTNSGFPHRPGTPWEMGDRFPFILGNRSTLWLLLTPPGACCLVAWLTVLPRRERVLLGCFAVAFVCAQMASTTMCLRYFEQIMFVWLGLAVGFSSQRERDDGVEPIKPVFGRVALLGPVLLALVVASQNFPRVSNVLENPPKPSQYASPHYWGPKYQPGPPPAYTEEMLPGAPK